MIPLFSNVVLAVTCSELTRSSDFFGLCSDLTPCFAMCVFVIVLSGKVMDIHEESLAVFAIYSHIKTNTAIYGSRGSLTHVATQSIEEHDPELLVQPCSGFTIKCRYSCMLFVILHRYKYLISDPT